LTKKTRLEDSSDVDTLATALGASADNQNQLRQSLLARINGALAGATMPSSLQELIAEGFLDWEGAEKAISDIKDANLAGSRLVIASGQNPDASNDQVALPLVRLLAAQPMHRLVAVESGRNADSNGSETRAVFLGPVRSDNDLNGELSTVDNIEASSGRVAVVLALALLSGGGTGDYGFGSSTDGLVPKTSS
jgi:hypothetical protein